MIYFHFIPRPGVNTVSLERLFALSEKASKLAGTDISFAFDALRRPDMPHVTDENGLGYTNDNSIDYTKQYGAIYDQILQEMS